MPHELPRELLRVQRTIEVFADSQKALNVQIKNSIVSGFRWVGKPGELGIDAGPWSVPEMVVVTTDDVWAPADDSKRKVHEPGKGYNGNGAPPVTDNPVKWWLQLELNTETGTIVSLRAMTDHEPSTIGPTRFALAFNQPLTWENAQTVIKGPVFAWAGKLHTDPDDGRAWRVR